MPARHRVKLEAFHYRWSRDHAPVLSVKDGDTVDFEINDVASWQITDKWTSKDLAKLDSSKLYPLAGPVEVEDARPGDALVVEVLNVAVKDFGWSCVVPGLGLLEEFRRPYLYKWDLKNKKFADFRGGIRIPLRPFCGVLGVSPAEKGSFDVAPPGRHGGNMDIRHLTAGSRVTIPIHVEGALFSAGDVHAAMGDGEVCLCAIECSGTARLRLSIERGARLRWPRYESKGEPQPKKGYYAATGISSDLMEAAKEAVRNMILYLTKEYGLSREEAYVLCSVAADLRIHEIVDQPNWVVGALVSRDIFPD